LNMAVLTEVHDAGETARAVALGARIIGVNNRDLRTLAIDMGTTPRLAPGIPEDRLVVAESGISSREDVDSQRAHADAFLVGSALMREPRLDAAVRRLVYGRTKVCGLTSPAHAAAAAVAGATHGGLVFAEGSPRRVTPDQAASVRGGATLEWVAVFADQPAEEIAMLAERLELGAVQLHGSESPDRVARVRDIVPASCEVWKAVRVSERIPALAETGADRLLLDGWTGGRLGGSGKAFDWSLLDGDPRRFRVVLAGGLNAGNAEAAAALRPWALDLSTGVESAPGIKDESMLRRFFAARRRLPGRGARAT
jgi:indole-3-glycerol phosphate synthase / phosphoribosylanthranilate isomerase